jgi:hypothetical protein
MGVAIMVDRPMAWLFWRILDALDYWLTQARLWVVDVRPEARDGANQQWQRDFAERVLIQSSREGRKEAILWMSIKF